MPVPEATEVEVKSLEEVDALVKHAAAFKVTAPNRVNQQSSRSHCVLVVNILRRAGAGLRASRLVLADLAGSEKVSRTEARGLRLEEARNINRSLLALGKVVHALCARLPHVPYRDSKLTRILKQSLGGNSRTLLVVHISPCADAAAESLSTLLFASRARLVTNCPQVNSVEPGPGATPRLLRQLVLMRKLIRGLARDPGFVLSPEQEQLYANDALSDSGFADLILGEDAFEDVGAASAFSAGSGSSGDSEDVENSENQESSIGVEFGELTGRAPLRATDFCDSADPVSILRLQSVQLLDECFGAAELARVRDEQENALEVCTKCQFFAGVHWLLEHFKFSQAEVAGSISTLVATTFATPEGEQGVFLSTLATLCKRLPSSERNGAPVQLLLQQNQSEFSVRVLQALLDQNFSLAEDEWAAVMDCVYFGATEALRVVVNHIVEMKTSGNKISASTLVKLGVIRAFHLAIKLFDRLAMLVFLEHQVLVMPLLKTESQG